MTMTSRPSDAAEARTLRTSCAARPRRSQPECRPGKPSLWWVENKMQKINVCVQYKTAFKRKRRSFFHFFCTSLHFSTDGVWVHIFFCFKKKFFRETIYMLSFPPHLLTICASSYILFGFGAEEWEEEWVDDDWFPPVPVPPLEELLPSCCCCCCCCCWLSWFMATMAEDGCDDLKSIRHPDPLKFRTTVIVVFFHLLPSQLQHRE